LYEIANALLMFNSDHQKSNMQLIVRR